MMKYSRPRLRVFRPNDEAWCRSGSQAVASGCTTGPDVGNSCAPGTTGGTEVCIDGASTESCAAGSTPSTAFDRCQSGGTAS